MPIYVDIEDITISPGGRNPTISLNLSNLINPDASLPDARIAWGPPPDDGQPGGVPIPNDGRVRSSPASTTWPRRSRTPWGRATRLARSPRTAAPTRSPAASTSRRVYPPDPVRGVWVGLSNAFLGWQVDVPGGSPHVGWLRLSLDNAGNFTLHDFAVESDANTSIRAGQTAAVPEAGTLAMLALGAAGVALWRRGRRSA